MKYLAFWRLSYSVPMWLLFLVVYIPLILLGWLLIPLATYSGAYGKRKSKFYDYDILSFTWPFMYIFGNEEDSIINGKQYFDAGSERAQIVYWSMIRNPVNNLRFIRPFSFLLAPDKVGHIGSCTNLDDYDKLTPQWFFAWHGLYSNLFWQFKLNGKLKRFWIGWAIYPTDVRGVTRYRQFGVMFTIQYKTVKIL